MRCDACGSGDSLFVVVSGNSQCETRLCRACALEKGYLSAEGEAALPQLDSMLAQLDKTGETEGCCAECGMGADQLAGSGRLGCPACIQVFKRQFILARKRRGLPVGYAGKVPRDYAGKAPRDAAEKVPRNTAGPVAGQGDIPFTGTLESSRLLADIESAVLAEDFERAAFLRDRLGSVGASGKSGNVT